MAHDYAKRPRNGRNSREKPKANSGGPIWLITGVFCGLFLAFLLQLAGVSLVPGAAAPDPRSVAANSNAEATSVEQPPDEASSKPRFEFYSMLREAEVDVQEEAQTGTVKSSANTPSSSQTRQAEANRGAEKSAPATNGTRYVLQAGSFKRKDDADRLRARLLLMGLEVNVERVKMGAFDSRHRVLVGPFNSRRETAQVRNQLTSEKMETLVLERKAP